MKPNKNSDNDSLGTSSILTAAVSMSSVHYQPVKGT